MHIHLIALGVATVFMPGAVLAGEPAPPSPFSPEVTLPATTGVGHKSAAVDSRGYLHVAYYQSSPEAQRNSTADDLVVALYGPDGSGGHDVVVGATTIDVHEGYDDRFPTVVTVPSDGPVDRTFVFNGSSAGHAFLTEIDFAADDRDGDPALPQSIVTTSYFIALPLSVQHPHMAVGVDGNLHIAFVGSHSLGRQSFTKNKTDRGVYYLQLSQTGEPLVGPVELYLSAPPNHPHIHPRLAIAGDGSIHGVFRAGTCGWGRGKGNVGCDLYSFKLTAAGDMLIPATRIALAPAYAFDKMPAVAVGPNGNVNIVYAGYQGIRGVGGSSQLGRGLYLTVVSTVGDEVTLLLDNHQLVAPTGSTAIYNYKMPGLATDEGGNLYVASYEDQDSKQTWFWVFNPRGEGLYGPVRANVSGDSGRDPMSVQVGGDRVYVTGVTPVAGQPIITTLDVAGFGFDKSGDDQIPPPQSTLSITSVRPSAIPRGSQRTITVQGTGFRSTASISIGGVELTDIVRYDSENLLGTLHSTPLELGTYDVVVANPDDTQTLAGAFTIEATDLQGLDDDGGCACRASSLSSRGATALVIVGILGWILRRRRSPSSTAVAIFAIVMASGSARADFGRAPVAGLSWADNQAAGKPLFARYALPPTFDGNGSGTISYPVVSEIYDWDADRPAQPVETISVTATGPTTFSVTGSVSGSMGIATTNVPYDSGTGITFTITDGVTLFSAGDTFTFAIVDSIDASALPQAGSHKAIDGHLWLLSPNTYPGYSSDTFPVFSPNHDSALIVSPTGYVSSIASITDDGNPVRFAGDNSALPARTVLGRSDRHGSTVFGFWDALAAKAASRMYVAVLGDPGNRLLIIQWKDFAHQDDVTASYTFEVIVFESDARARVHYRSMQDGLAGFADGSSATIGVQPPLADTFAAVSYSHDQAGVVTDGRIIEFGLDADGDGLPSGFELQYGTSPSDSTSDGDPATDGAQLLAGANPTTANDISIADSDDDGVLDIEEDFVGLDPNDADTDNDGVDDGVELAAGMSALRKDSDRDGLDDGEEDDNGNGMVDASETSPLDWDSDDDGSSDGFEDDDGTDPLDASSTRFTALAQIPTSRGSQQSVVDSHGHQHLVWYAQGTHTNDTPDDLYVALYSPDGSGGYQMAVAPTAIAAHVGYDDRPGTLVTVPGDGPVDTTFVFNSTTRGHAFLTVIDFDEDDRDGNAAVSADIVTSTYFVPLPLSVQHPRMVLGEDGNLHIAFVGSQVFDGSGRFIENRVDRGVYYLELSQTGQIVTGPVELYRSSPPNHPHIHPRLALGPDQSVYGVFRAGLCSWNRGNTGCHLYLFKISPIGQVVVPATRLAMAPDLRIERMADLAISPNGNVNLVFAGYRSTGSYDGGFGFGRGLILHVVSTVGDEITTLLDTAQLVPVELQPWGRDATFGMPNFRPPSVACDRGGNLHIVAGDQVNANQGMYAVFTPAGVLDAGPLVISGQPGRDGPSLSLSGDRAFISYSSEATLHATSLDVSNLGLDLSGDSQLDPPRLIVHLESISPASAEPGQRVLVSLRGAGFRSTATASIGGVPLTGLRRLSSTRLVGYVDASNLTEGIYDVTVANPDGQATLPNGFTVGTPNLKPPFRDDGCAVMGRSRWLAAAFVLGLFLIRRRRRS